jgi:hypothetical protein
MKWYFLNAKARFALAARRPGYVLKAVARELTFADERFLANATGTSAIQIRRFLQEPFDDPDFLANLRCCEAAFRNGMVSADLWAKKVLIQYAVVRALRPDIIVETGVASGVSSAYFLVALQRNRAGMLHSVEIGDSSYLPPGKRPGWIVPEGLRTRWKVHVGDAAAVLPGLLRQLRGINVFVHDSLHTYEHMKLEFELVYPYIKPGGMLFADDALWNAAFTEFANAVSSPASRIIRGVGMMKK